MELPAFRERPYPVDFESLQRTGTKACTFRPVGLVRCIKKTHLQVVPTSGISSVSAFLVILYHIFLVQDSDFYSELFCQFDDKFSYLWAVFANH